MPDDKTPPSGTATDDAPPPGGAGTSGTDEGWKAPENKAALDKLINDAVADAVSKESAKYKAPSKYSLKLSDKVAVDPTLVERTGAIARDLGLSEDKAQKTLDFVTQEAAREAEAALTAWSAPSEENPEGGAKWKEQNDAWRAASLADKELGDGKPEVLTAKTALAKKVLAKFGDAKSIDFLDSALGSNPALLRILVRIGGAMSEQGLVTVPQDGKPAKEKSLPELMYPTMTD